MPIETTATVVADVPDDAELLAVPYAADLSPGVELPLPVSDLLAHYEAKGAAGEIVEVPVARAGGVGRILLYGVGDGSPKALRTAAAGLTRRAKGRDTLTVVTPDGDVAAFAEAALLAAYTFRIGGAGKQAVRALVLAGADEEQVRRAETVARAGGARPRPWPTRRPPSRTRLAGRAGAALRRSPLGQPGGVLDGGRRVGQVAGEQHTARATVSARRTCSSSARARARARPCLPAPPILNVYAASSARLGERGDVAVGCPHGQRVAALGPPGQPRAAVRRALGEPSPTPYSRIRPTPPARATGTIDDLARRALAS
ncbi:hypothetical protein GCM10020220_094300 [Nonomuraea rubra]|uniref:M17 family peptidase N-terminal domain-containing protein n=1 Tax=Nonomuraea rubra TaxID=46180 RepID=UPI0031E9D6FC